jgi:lysozyme
MSKEEIVLDEMAVKVAIKIIKMFEGCELRAYPDPASDLYKVMAAQGILKKYLKGLCDIPKEMLKDFDGKPWTAMWGETEGIKCGDVFTQEQADERLEKRVREFMKGVLKACPQLKKEPYTRAAACTSFAYNIGLGNFAKSTVCKKTMEKEYLTAAQSFHMWNKAKGAVLDGLVKRRKLEADLYMSEIHK